MVAITREHMGDMWRLIVPFRDVQVRPLFPNEVLRRRFAEGVYYQRTRRYPRSAVADYGRLVRDLFRLAAGPVGDMFAGAEVDLSWTLVTGAVCDDDAWYILAKYALDGLTDAKLWPKDRRVIRRTSGQIFRADDVPGWGRGEATFGVEIRKAESS